MKTKKTKICPTCQIVHPTSMFSKNMQRKDKLGYYCKSCEKIRTANWLSISKNREYSRRNAAKYYYENKDKRKEYQIKNKNKRVDYMKLWRNKKSEHIKQYKKEYNKNIQSKDINYRLLHNLRTRLQLAVKSNNAKKCERTMELVGCDIYTLKLHLQLKFTSDMTWGNYGRKGWHIDHILPCSSFDLSKKEEQRKCFHYTNLQPLWWLDNCKKSNTIGHFSNNPED
jgi:hypothetical protein